MDWASLTSRQRYLVIGSVVLLVILLIGGGIAWYDTLQAWNEEGDGQVSGESTRTVETTATRSAEATRSISATASVNATLSPSGAAVQSTTRFGYVRSVVGSPGDYRVTVDYFDFLTDPEATEYAKSHGMTPPDNGLLFVNEDVRAVLLPLSETVEVRYATGGVMALELVPSTVAQLKAWAAGDLNAMPNASTDWWKITVADGAVTRIEMLVIAD